VFHKNSVIELKLPWRGDYECVCEREREREWARATSHNFLPAGMKTNTDNFLSSVLLTSYRQVRKTKDKN